MPAGHAPAPEESSPKRRSRGLDSSGAGAIQGLRGGRAPSEPDEPAFHGASLRQAAWEGGRGFQWPARGGTPHIPQRTGRWKPRRSSGERGSPASAGLGSEMGECGATRPRETAALRGRGVVEYAPVPQRMRELTRVETCKTPFGAGSAKREACFFSGGSKAKRQAMGRNRPHRFRDRSNRHGSPTDSLFAEVDQQFWNWSK